MFTITSSRPTILSSYCCLVRTSMPGKSATTSLRTTASPAVFQPLALEQERVGVGHRRKGAERRQRYRDPAEQHRIVVEADGIELPPPPCRRLDREGLTGL